MLVRRPHAWRMSDAGLWTAAAPSARVGAHTLLQEMPMRLLACAALLLAIALPAVAEPLPAPGGEPALTIAGAVSRPNAGSEVALDLATIAGLGAGTIETTTDWEWHDGPQTFTGVPLLSVLDAAGATGDTLTVTAADAYASTMSRADLTKHDALLATALNGAPLTAESFGPLWLVFPYDAMADPAERKAYTDRSVWSVVRIDVE